MSLLTSYLQALPSTYVPTPSETDPPSSPETLPHAHATQSRASHPYLKPPLVIWFANFASSSPPCDQRFVVVSDMLHDAKV